MQPYGMAMNLTRTQRRVAERLRHYREERDLTQEALCAAIGINSRQTLAEIEGLKRPITAEELARAASALNVSIEHFLDPFRLLGEGQFNFRMDEATPSVVSEFEERVERWVAMYRHLGEEEGAPPTIMSDRLHGLTRHSEFEEVEAAAERLVQRWKLGRCPAARLPSAIEERLGALVLFVDAPKGISGAAVHLKDLETVLVNRTESPGRQSYDLAHELFHVLTWQQMPPRRVETIGAARGKGSRVEQLANCFASAVLMPAEAVHHRWNASHGLSAGLWIAHQANEWRVSIPALTWRLVTLKLISKAERAQLEADGRSSRGVTDTPMPLPFSRMFLERIQRAIASGRLGEAVATRALDLEYVEDLEELFAAHGLGREAPIPA